MMKMKMSLKKLMAIGAASTLALSVTACSSTSTTATTAAETQSAAAETTASAEETSAEAVSEETSDTAEYQIAIVKQLDHASLDEITNAIEAELDAIAADKNVTIHYTTYSGQNDQTTLKQIGDQAIADGVDAVIPVATLAAQVMTVCAEETETPVVYAAISDPEAADLTGISYVTGTSDALNTGFILDMMTAVDEDIQSVGLLYSLS